MALRPLREADAEALVEHELDPLSQRWAMFTAAGRRRALSGPASPVALRLAWSASLPDSRSPTPPPAAFAGTLDVRLVRTARRRADRLHASTRTFRGRGYTARALRLATPWLFEQAGFARLELGAKVDNVASQKAALAGGFLADGVRAARLRNPDGSYSDEAQFFLVNPVARK